MTSRAAHAVAPIQTSKMVTSTAAIRSCVSLFASAANITEASMNDLDDRPQHLSLPSRRNILRGVAGGTLAATLPACASPERGPAVPTGQASRASVLGVPNERFFPASNVAALEKEFYDS